MSSPAPTLPSTLLDSFLTLSTPLRIRWYMCIIVSLSSLNYPEVIPQVYKHFDSTLLSQLDEKERFSAAQQVREGLIKSTGIVGAARTGNAMRTLSECMPDEFREQESPRSKESDEVARKRGRQFWLNVYARNPLFDPVKTERASPDYAFIVRDLLYARVFSYDGVLDPLTSGFAMVAGLYGIDTRNQLRNHMIGMLYNGATREDLQELQRLCLAVAEALGVKSRFGPVEIPSIQEK
ncbi:hypothetical protein H2200_007085 [Cladophialophora chaetospira]|uniref:Carboxymuconolactone decarboxylase n=1 Tax=Cladophialophora chaetospira TaxID=386627 RepID=A0AA39CH68_9EURO|nr:hypothetical protein H2200_007085 [Cladophialophora chaetospira]